MSRKDDRRTLWDVIDILDKDHASILKGFDDMLVVDDGMSDIKRSAMSLQRKFDNFNGKGDPGTESAGGGKENLLHSKDRDFILRKGEPGHGDRKTAYARIRWKTGTTLTEGAHLGAFFL